MNDSFSYYHPAVNFYYFLFVIFCSMFFMHPAFLAANFIVSFVYSIVINGKKALKFNFFYCISLFLITSLINPLFNRRGANILFYAFGNPVTMQSVIYGIFTAMIFVSVIWWFSSYNVIMTSDKFVYLFGRLMPSISLVITMVLRLIPRYKTQIKAITSAQKCVGMDLSSGSFIQRAKNGTKIISVLTSWAMENSIDTADSMKARGYDAATGRTFFSNYRLTKRDIRTLSLMAMLSIIIISGQIFGAGQISFFPEIVISNLNFYSAAVYLSYFLFCMLPLIIDAGEGLSWKFSISKF